MSREQWKQGAARAIGAITMLVAVRSAVEQALQRPLLEPSSLGPRENRSIRDSIPVYNGQPYPPILFHMVGGEDTLPHIVWVSP